MRIRNLAVLTALSSLALATSACSSVPAVGPYNGLSSDPMAMLVVTSSSDQITFSQYEIVTAAAALAFRQVSPQLSSVEEAAFVKCAATSLTNGAGSGLGANEAFETIASMDYFIFGAITGCFSGGDYGTIIASQAKVGVVAAAANNMLYDWAHEVVPVPASIVRAVEKSADEIARECAGLHVAASYIRTRNTSERPAPGVVPELSGPPSGA